MFWNSSWGLESKNSSNFWPYIYSQDGYKKAGLILYLKKEQELEELAAIALNQQDKLDLFLDAVGHRGDNPLQLEPVLTYGLLV